MTNLKFMYNGIKLNGQLSKAHYSKGPFHNLPEETMVIRSKSYEPLPRIEGLNLENESDMQTDYSEKDHFYVTPENKYYEMVCAAYEKQEAKLEAKRIA